MATQPTYTYANVAVPNGGYTYPSNITLTGSQGAGLTYTTATGAGNWATTTAVDTWYTRQPKVKITDEDIELNGLSLKETMLAIKNELQLPTRINRNLELEKEFAELQQAAEHYYELECKFLEQKKMWETLKK